MFQGAINTQHKQPIDCRLLRSRSFSDISVRLSTSSFMGAWMTITVEPRIHNTQPIFPNKFSFSSNKLEANTELRPNYKS